MSTKTEYKKLAVRDDECGEDEKVRNYGATTKPEVRPDNHFQTALLAVVICCPLGILALINSLKVNRHFDQGDIEASRSVSERALGYYHRAVALGIVVLGAVLMLFGSALIFLFIYCYDHYRYYGYI